MKQKRPVFLITAALAASMAAQGQPPGASSAPQLRRQGTATQLIVDGKPFLALAGELGNNTASSLENMQSVWPRLVSGNLNCVLAAVSWAQVEPEEGKFDFSLVEGLIQEARRHNLKLVFLWFGSWKNGLSSYTPLWVKKDYKRFPRIRLGNGGTLELLSTFSGATRDADARAFGALMRYIKSADSTHHTVVMMQVENEVGVLRDTRDRSDAANRAFSGQVPRELMDYLSRHRQSLAPELLGVWSARGFKTTGTWEEVFGPGKPASEVVPIRTLSPPMSRQEYETAWREWRWAADEIFMAWHYARYINRVIEEGKAEYGIPMFVNAWLQQPSHAWPGTYPSGGPLPQVADIWRAGAPSCDILTPDIYIPQFDETVQRFIRNGNPMLVPETFASGRNAMVAFGAYGAIGFSPFFIERMAGPDTELAAAYRVISDMAPVITAHQGKETIAAVRIQQGDSVRKIRLGEYTLDLTFLGRGRIPIAPEQPVQPAAQPAKPASPRSPQGAPPVASPGAPGPSPAEGPAQGAAILIASGPGEFYFGGIGGALRITFTPETPGPAIAGLGVVQEGRFVDGIWRAVRQLGGDDTAQGEILTLRASQVLRVTLYRYQ